MNCKELVNKVVKKHNSQDADFEDIFVFRKRDLDDIDYSPKWNILSDLIEFRLRSEIEIADISSLHFLTKAIQIHWLSSYVSIKIDLVGENKDLISGVILSFLSSFSKTGFPEWLHLELRGHRSWIWPEEIACFANIVKKFWFKRNQKFKFATNDHIWDQSMKYVSDAIRKKGLAEWLTLSINGSGITDKWMRYLANAIQHVWLQEGVSFDFSNNPQIGDIWFGHLVGVFGRIWFKRWMNVDFVNCGIWTTWLAVILSVIEKVWLQEGMCLRVQDMDSIFDLEVLRKQIRKMWRIDWEIIPSTENWNRPRKFHLRWNCMMVRHY